MSIFLVYAREAIEMGRKGVWGVDKVRAEAVEGFRRITIDSTYKVGDFTYWTDGGAILRETQRAFETMDEWRQFEDELLELAKSRRLARTDPAALSDSTKRKLDLQGEASREDRNARAEAGAHAAAGGAMANLQELPPKQQNVFEAAKAKAELAYATRTELLPHNPQFANNPIHKLKLIQDVLFA
jgi:hypothetical protein